MALAVGIGTAIFGIGSAVDQRNRSKRAERKAEKLEAVQQAQVADTAARERRRQIREQRAAMASIENRAAVAGQTGSSAAIAGAAGVQGQVNENIGQINTTLSTSAYSAALQEDIFKLQQPSDTQYVLGAVQSVVSGYDGYKRAKQ